MSARPPREPILAQVAPGVTSIDTGMAGQRELNAVYLLAGQEPCLVETGPGADGEIVRQGLERLGLGGQDLAHVVVTHIHMDHAGGAGALLVRYPRAILWVHERGATHVVDPSRLIASTARTYGEHRMAELYGETLPCPVDRVRAVVDGDRIPLGGRDLEVLHTPGHAAHHIALLDDATGSLFTGEAIGSYLPWGTCYRPALPPPEVDVERALDSIARMRRRRPTSLLTSHFGVVSDPEEGFQRGAQRIRAWSEVVRRALAADPMQTDDAIEALLVAQARREYEADSGASFDRDRGRYDALGSIRMNAQGLGRYWRTRVEREGAEDLS